MKGRRSVTLLLALSVTFLLAFVAQLRLSLDAEHRAPVASQMFGPFRGLMASYEWVKIYQHQRSYRYEKVVDSTLWVCDLQPHVVEAWDYLAWNLSFNLYVEAGHDLDERWLWLERGLDQLDRGLLINRQHEHLLFAKAVALHLKSDQSREMAHRMSKKYGRAVEQVAKECLLKSGRMNSGELSDVEMGLSILREAGAIDLAVEACRLQMQRKPSLRVKFQEYINLLERERH